MIEGDSDVPSRIQLTGPGKAGRLMGFEGISLGDVHEVALGRVSVLRRVRGLFLQ